MSLAEIVRAMRTRALLTQEELAQRSGLSVGTIRGIEVGRIRHPRGSSVRRLADALALTDLDRERLLAAVRDESGVEHVGVTPAQLPAVTADFAGRAAELGVLDGLLERAGIGVVTGTAGVGKTALAAHWAHRVAHRFPDGQLHADLRGFDPSGDPADPGDVLRGFLEALGVSPHRIPSTLDGQCGLYRSVLAARRLLILLDNARDAEQVRPLLPGAAGCLAVVTGRDQLSGLVETEGALPVRLDVLSPAESRQLLALRLGEARVAAEPGAVDQIIARCAGLPLTLAIVAARAALHPEFTLGALAAQLRQDPLSGARAVFSWSYGALDAPAARLFRLLGLHSGPDIAAPAAASLAGIAPQEVRPLLARLASAQLIAEPDAGRYGMHDLLRAYAIELAQATDGDAELRAAAGRLIDHYRLAAAMAMDAAYPGERMRRPRIAPPFGQDGESPDERMRRPRIAPPFGQDGESPGERMRRPRIEPTDARAADPGQALAWLDAELPNLLAAARHAAGNGWAEQAWHLPAILHSHLQGRGRYRDAEILHSEALSAARSAGDPIGELNALIGLGHLHWLRDDQGQAIDHFDRAGDIALAAGDPLGAVRALNGLGWLGWFQGRSDEAAARFEQALPIAVAGGNGPGEADALTGLGWVHSRREDYARAAVHFERSLAIARAAGHGAGELLALQGLCYVWLSQGDPARALDGFARARDMARAIRHRDGELYAVLALGDVHRAGGDHERADRFYREGLELARVLGNSNAEQRALRALSVTR